MTPKEKAIDLVNKFKIRSIELGHGHSQFFAEANALIAVDEILDTYDDTNNEDYKLINYWQEVKQEIEKL